MSKFTTTISKQADQAAAQAFLAAAPGAKPDAKAGQRQINVRVSPDQWLKLKMYCLREGISMQDWIVGHIEQLEV